MNKCRRFSAALFRMIWALHHVDVWSSRHLSRLRAPKLPFSSPTAQFTTAHSCNEWTLSLINSCILSAEDEVAGQLCGTHKWWLWLLQCWLSMQRETKHCFSSELEIASANRAQQLAPSFSAAFVLSVIFPLIFTIGVSKASSDWKTSKSWTKPTSVFKITDFFIRSYKSMYLRSFMIEVQNI